MVAGVSEAVRAGGDWISVPRVGGAAGAGVGMLSSLPPPHADNISEHAAIDSNTRALCISKSSRFPQRNARAPRIVTIAAPIGPGVHMSFASRSARLFPTVV